MDEFYVGREAWKNENMAVSDAKQWLAEIALDDPSLTAMLLRVAKGEYPKILGQNIQLLQRYICHRQELHQVLFLFHLTRCYVDRNRRATKLSHSY